MILVLGALVRFPHTPIPPSPPGSLPKDPQEPQQQNQKGSSSFQLVSLIRRLKSLQNNHGTLRDGRTEPTGGEGALKAALPGPGRDSGAGRAGPGAPRGAGSSSRTGRQKELEPVAGTRGFISLFEPRSIPVARREREAPALVPKTQTTAQITRIAGKSLSSSGGSGPTSATPGGHGQGDRGAQGSPRAWPQRSRCSGL